MVPNNHLQLFAQQLATWAEQIIENGRTPFRRVDLFHHLHTSEGSCRPPLIFWINRQSMIAGGLVFLPDNTTDPRFTKEAAAAKSLGLRHFVTWEAEKINIWEVTVEGNILITALPLAQTQDPATFHHRLYELIDQLKLLSVTGRINAEEISAYYLLNLLEETLALSAPALIEYCRIQLSENMSVLTAEEEAKSLNRLSMLRMLCLLNWEILPVNVPIEQLTASSEKLLSDLPEPLGHILQTLTPEPSLELPAESAVAFHHLLLRLQQIGWQRQERRGEKTLRLLLHLWHGDSPHKVSITSKERLLLHSRELAPICSREISHSGAQLAANALMRVLDKQTHPIQLQGDTFRISSPFEESLLHANFYGSQRPATPLRRELAGHLRNSWPNRRLIIPGNLPFWATEAAHFLGLTAQNSQVELHLPANWLQLLIDSFFCELIFTNFVLDEVDCREEKRHLLKLCRRQGETTTNCLLANGRERSLELGMDYPQAASKLLCALELPSQLFDLFTEQQLVPLTESSEEASHPLALTGYSRTRIGQQLWKMRTQAPIPETTERLLAEGKELNWLVPEVSCLKELSQRLAINNNPNVIPQLDEQLNQLFDLPPEFSSLQIKTTDTETAQPKQINRNLGDELLRLLEIEEIPRFPQTYLYRQATGPLNSYRFAPPLNIRQELLGQYELEDAMGQVFQVTGEETKEALLLASILGLTTLEMSGLSDKEVALNVVKSGAQDFLLKGDFDDKLLLKSITYSIERRKNIELLKQSEHKYRILFEDSPLPMFIVDADTHKIQIVNSAAIDKYGFQREEFENISIDEIIEDEAIAKIEKLNEKNRKLNFQCNQKIKGGKEIITNSNVNLINVNTEKAYLFLSEDITERILFEKNKLALTSNIQDVERKNLSMELHDGIAQELVLLNIYADQLKDKFQDDLIDKFREILQNTMIQTRRLSYNISPPDLDNGFFEGLKNMFERLSSVNEIKIVLDWNIKSFDDCIIESEVGYNIFRIIQEFLNNSLKHSNASSIVLRVDRYENEIYFDIQDNGVGFDMSDENNWGLGIKNIKQRAKLHQINYSFLSKINEGTRLSFNISLENKPLLNNNFSA